MIIIAIDGPAGAGKGTLSQLIANYYGWLHLDTGLIYRFLSYNYLQSLHPMVPEAPHTYNFDLATDLAQSLNFKQMPNPKLLRTEDVAKVASNIAVNANLRTILTNKIKAYLNQLLIEGTPGIVLDGRDVGTVIVPTADYKFFITASAEVRAKRRALEINQIEQFDTILKTINERDERDKSRSASPLVAAPDASHIDSSNLSPQQLLHTALNIIGNTPKSKVWG